MSTVQPAAVGPQVHEAQVCDFANFEGLRFRDVGVLPLSSAGMFVGPVAWLSPAAVSSLWACRNPKKRRTMMWMKRSVTATRRVAI